MKGTSNTHTKYMNIKKNDNIKVYTYIENYFILFFAFHYYNKLVNLIKVQTF